MATADVRAYLQARISAAAERCYYGVAQDSAEYPFVTWNLELVALESGLSLEELEIDVIDHGTNSEPAEDLADQIITLLDHHYALQPAFQAAIYLERRQPIQENDKSIIRRRLTFQMRLHERSST